MQPGRGDALGFLSLHELDLSHAIQYKDVWAVSADTTKLYSLS